MDGALQAAPHVSLVDGLVLAQLLASGVALSGLRESQILRGAALLGLATLAASLLLLAFDALLLGPTTLRVLRWPAAALIAGAVAAFALYWWERREPRPVAGAQWLYGCALLGNGALIGSAVLAESDAQGMAAALAWAVLAAAGIAVVLASFLLLRARLAEAELPLAFRGLPATLLAAAIVALALLGFSGVGFA
jgi:electron transport complex protein RnfA